MTFALKTERRMTVFGNGFFGRAFDFDGNGKLEGFERAADFALFMQVMEEEERLRREREEDEDGD